MKILFALLPFVLFVSCGQDEEQAAAPSFASPFSIQALAPAGLNQDPRLAGLGTIRKGEPVGLGQVISAAKSTEVNWAISQGRGMTEATLEQFLNDINLGNPHQDILNSKEFWYEGLNAAQIDESIQNLSELINRRHLSSATGTRMAAFQIAQGRGATPDFFRNRYVVVYTPNGTHLGRVNAAAELELTSMYHRGQAKQVIPISQLMNANNRAKFRMVDVRYYLLYNALSRYIPANQWVEVCNQSMDQTLVEYAINENNQDRLTTTPNLNRNPNQNPAQNQANQNRQARNVIQDGCAYPNKNINRQMGEPKAQHNFQLVNIKQNTSAGQNNQSPRGQHNAYMTLAMPQIGPTVELNNNWKQSINQLNLSAGVKEAIISIVREFKTNGEISKLFNEAPKQDRQNRELNSIEIELNPTSRRSVETRRSQRQNYRQTRRQMTKQVRNYRRDVIRRSRGRRMNNPPQRPPVRTTPAPVTARFNVRVYLKSSNRFDSIFRVTIPEVCENFTAKLSTPNTEILNPYQAPLFHNVSWESTSRTDPRTQQFISKSSMSCSFGIKQTPVDNRTQNQGQNNQS